MNDRRFEILSDRAKENATRLLEVIAEAGKVPNAWDKTAQSLRRELQRVSVSVKQLIKLHSLVTEARSRWRKRVASGRVDRELPSLDAPSFDDFES